jgi:HSP20 family protein
LFDPRSRLPGNLDQLQREMERYLDHVAHKKPHTVVFSQRTWQPAVDVFECEDRVCAVVDLSGVKQEDMELIVGRSTLTLRGERRDPGERADRRFAVMEIPFGPFDRTLQLPAAVNPDEVSATYEAGFLRIDMPKAGPGAPRRVTVTRA